MAADVIPSKATRAVKSPPANDIELLGSNPAGVRLRDVAPLPDDLSLRDYLDLRLYPLERLQYQLETIGTQITTMQVALAGTITRTQYDELIDRISELEKQLAMQRGFGSGSRAAWAVMLAIGAMVVGFAGALLGALLHR